MHKALIYILLGMLWLLKKKVPGAGLEPARP